MPLDKAPPPNIHVAESVGTNSASSYGRRKCIVCIGIEPGNAIRAPQIREANCPLHRPRIAESIRYEA